MHVGRPVAALAREDRGARPGVLLRHRGDAGGARALGRQERRVRSDGTAARRSRPRLAGGADQPVPDDARLRLGGVAPRTRGVRRDRRNAAARPPARPRVRRRGPLRDEVPRRPRRRASRSGRVQAPGRCRTPPRVPLAHGARPCRGHGLAAPARARDARGAYGASDGERTRDRRAAPGPRRRAHRALPRIRRSPLVRRRGRGRRATRRDVHEADRECDQPGRSDVPDRGTRALGGRPSPTGPPAALGGARGSRRALARPRRGARPEPR